MQHRCAILLFMPVRFTTFSRTNAFDSASNRLALVPLALLLPFLLRKSPRYWAAQTQRSLQNFDIGGERERMPEPIVKAFGVLKKSAAKVRERGIPNGEKSRTKKEKKIIALTKNRMRPFIL